MVGPLLNAPPVAFGTDLRALVRDVPMRLLRAPLLLGDLMHVKRVAALAAPFLAIPGALLLMSPTADAATCSNVGQVVTCTFALSENWVVPAGVTSLAVTAQGESGEDVGANEGGRGAIASGTFSVLPGEVIGVRIGTSPNDVGAAGDGSGGDGGGSTTVEGPGEFLVAGGGGGAATGGAGGNAGAPGAGVGGVGADGNGGSAMTPLVATPGGTGGGGGGAGSMGVGNAGGGQGGTANGGGGGGASAVSNAVPNGFSLAPDDAAGSATIVYTDPNLPVVSPTPAPSPAPSAPGTCNGQAVTINQGGSGNQDVVGTAGNDVVNLGSGNDSFVGNGGNDVVCGGSGNDEITTGDGNDTVFAGSGDDDVDAGGGTNSVDMGSGEL